MEARLYPTGVATLISWLIEPIHSDDAPLVVRLTNTAPVSRGASRPLLAQVATISSRWRAARERRSTPPRNVCANSSHQRRSRIPVTPPTPGDAIVRYFQTSLGLLLDLKRSANRATYLRGCRGKWR